MSEFKVGDRVRVIEGGFEGTIEEVVRVDHPHYSYNSGEYSYMYRVADKYKYFHGLDANELELIEASKQSTLGELEQRIEKLEKEVFKPVVEHDKPKGKSLLTEDERVILRNLDKKWKWIARDEDRDDLHVYSLEPVKTVYEWNVEGVMNFENFYIFNHLFQFIKWEDDEPYNIEELLKGECGNEN